MIFKPCLSTCVTFAIFLRQNISLGSLPLHDSHRPNNSSLFFVPVPPVHPLPPPPPPHPRLCLHCGLCQICTELGSCCDNLLKDAAPLWIRAASPLVLPAFNAISSCLPYTDSPQFIASRLRWPQRLGADMFYRQRSYIKKKKEKIRKADVH